MQLLEQREHVSLTEEHIKILAYNMLCAAEYLHERNIVHRDLKPGNVLINSDCNVKFCDFGLSRSLHQKPNATSNLPDQSPVIQNVDSF